MTGSISKAMERAKVHNRGRFSVQQVRREPVFPTAKPVNVSQEVMERNRLIGGIMDQKVIDCYSLLRARMLHRVRQQDLKTIGVTSPSAKDGKTLTAVNLAISTAIGETHSVLLVDADVRRPSVAKLFGLDVRAGLGDYLMGDVELDEVLLRPPIDGLVILPGRAESPLRPEGLSSSKMFQLINDLKQQNPGGILIFDLCPALVGGDVVTFAPNLDATLLVVADHRTNEDALARTLPLLEGANVIGTVLNFADDVMTSDDYYAGR